jgi:hypothetical protein
MLLCERGTFPLNYLNFKKPQTRIAPVSKCFDTNVYDPNQTHKINAISHTHGPFSNNFHCGLSFKYDHSLAVFPNIPVVKKQKVE